MKFTEQEAYNELVAELKKKEANPLINERAIKDVIKDDFVLMKDSEIELVDYVKQRFNSIKSIDGNVRKVAATQIAEMKKNEEKKLEDETNKKKETIENEEVSALKKQLDELSQKFIDVENQKKLIDKKSTLISKLKEVGIDNEAWIDDFVKEISITEDLDVDTKANSLLQLYNKHKAAITPITPPDGGGNPTAQETNYFTRISKLREADLEKDKKI